MAKLEFKNKTLEKLFRSWKWSRNNSIQMFQIANSANILGYAPKSSQFSFQPTSHQFQCLLTTTDAYYRQLAGAANKAFGVLVQNDKTVAKKDIGIAEIEHLLTTQVAKLEELFRNYDSKMFEENIKIIQAICNHEYLHQGQLLILFREADIDVPERFTKAFAL